ncbi:MAG: transposase [Methanophagales archaeon]|nr:transposase [Methanophagales archaeon]
MGSIEEWARKWLENQRHEGKTCLEIKTRGPKNYVYHSTNRYDKEIKKGRKVSKYLGRLDKERGFIPKGQNKHEHKYIAGPRNITEYGNSMLLHRMMEDIKPLLKEGFPEHWEEICALAMVRASGNVPLKRASDAWEKLYNADDTKPNLNPKNLSRVLREVGVNRAGQNVLFRELADMSKQLVYDLSSMFSRSMSINQAEKGYNKDKIHVPQINLALLCSADTGLPAMIRSLPGSVKDIKTLYHTINELDIGGKVLILDRGFFSEGTIKFLGGKETSYVLPTKRNSHYYDTRIHFTEFFTYHSRLIKCGRRKCGNFYLYLFEDQDLRLEEQKTLYRKKTEHKIEKKKFDDGMKKAGKILIISDMDVEKREIYLLHKKREVVEKMFDTYKTVLNADKLYLQDDESVFGHVFIAFLSLYIHCKLEQLLKKAKLNHKITPIDLLFKYSKVYHLEMRGHGMITEAPKRVMDLDEALGLYMFPKKVRS